MNEKQIQIIGKKSHHLYLFRILCIQFMFHIFRLCEDSKISSYKNPHNLYPGTPYPGGHILDPSKCN